MLVLFDLRSRNQAFGEQFFRLLKLLFSPLHVVFVERQQLSETCFVFICQSDEFVAELGEFSLRGLARAQVSSSSYVARRRQCKGSNYDNKARKNADDPLQINFCACLVGSLHQRTGATPTRVRKEIDDEGYHSQVALSS